MIRKTVADVSVALEGIQSGMTLMLGGFGLCGIPENLIKAIASSPFKDFTCISANVGTDDFGLGLLIKEKKVIKKGIFMYRSTSLKSSFVVNIIFDSLNLILNFKKKVNLIFIRST